jgi:hypothetical protein
VYGQPYRGFESLLLRHNQLAMHEIEIPYKDFAHLVRESHITFACGEGLERESYFYLAPEASRWFFESGTNEPFFIGKYVNPETEMLPEFSREYRLCFKFREHRDAISFKLAWV